MTDDATAQIARLREQVEALMRDKITPALDQASAQTEHMTEELVKTIRARPLTTIAIAAGIGFLLGSLRR